MESIPFNVRSNRQLEDLASGAFRVHLTGAPLLIQDLAAELLRIRGIVDSSTRKLMNDILEAPEKGSK